MLRKDQPAGIRLTCCCCGCCLSAIFSRCAANAARNTIRHCKCNLRQRGRGAACRERLREGERGGGATRGSLRCCCCCCWPRALLSPLILAKSKSPALREVLQMSFCPGRALHFQLASKLAAPAAAASANRSMVKAAAKRGLVGS